MICGPANYELVTRPTPHIYKQTLLGSLFMDFDFVSVIS